MKKIQNKIMAGVMTVAVAATTIGGFPATDVSAATAKVTSISVNKQKTSVYVGKQVKISVTKVNGVKPDNNKAVTYKSSNKKVATVSADGYVKGVKTGKATITVTSKYNNQAVAKVTVEVKQVKKIKVTNAVKGKLTVKKGKKVKLVTKTSPTNVKKSELKFKMKNTRVATVSKKGTVTGKSAGKTKLTITARYGKGKKAKKVITVTVPGRTKASSMSEGAYKYRFSKYANSYDIEYNDTVYNITGKDLLADFSTMLKQFAKTDFNASKYVETLTFDRLVKDYNLFADNKTLIKKHIDISGTATKRIVDIEGTKYTLTATKDSLTLKRGNTTVTYDKIKVKKTSAGYEVTFTVKESKNGKSRNYKAEVSSDYKKLVMYRENEKVCSFMKKDGTFKGNIDREFMGELKETYPNDPIFVKLVKEAKVYNVF